MSEKFQSVTYIRKLCKPSQYKRHQLNVLSMFHENVGKSAWGLAIHSKSRLIAVSTNIYQVTIFAFAIRSQSEDEEDEETIAMNEVLSMGSRDLFPNASYLPKSATESRHGGYRLVFRLNTHRDNIPTVAFVNDAEGEASMILAGDTAGRMVRLPSLQLCHGC